MSDFFNEEEITLDKLRENFHNNDFSTMPVKDTSEYSEKELKLYNRVLRLVNAEWKNHSQIIRINTPTGLFLKRLSARAYQR